MQMSQAGNDAGHGSGGMQAGVAYVTDQDKTGGEANKDTAGKSKPTAGLFKDLQSRGLVQDVSDPDLGHLLDRERVVLYCGFDPTSDSLQLGNLVPLISLARFQRAGHTPIVVLGGGTGMIGDPSGRSDERSLLDEETIARNAEAQESQCASVLDFDSADNPAILVNNFDWLSKLNLIDFLRDVGKSFSVSVMMSRESVRQRIAAEAGISFTEFSYQILQAYDFYHLYTNHGCRLQVGGSDQYGNILAGVDYIRRKTGRDHGAAALTYPLVLTSTGEKLGKTAAGALWLDPRRTSPYEWYQYWLNASDGDAVQYLKFFTFLQMDEIDEIERRFLARPKERLAQRTLAREVTTLIHGPEETENAERASVALFAEQTDPTGISTEDMSAGAPSINVPEDALASGYDLVEALLVADLAESKTGAKRLIRQGAVSINGTKVGADKRSINATDVQDDGSCLIAAGPRQRAVIRFSS